MFFTLVRFNGTVNTIRSFCCRGYVQADVLSGNIKTKSDALHRLLTQTIEVHKKINRSVRMTNTQKEKVEKDDSE